MIRKISTILVSLLVILVIFTGNSIADGNNGNNEPAPNSGDGVPDGPGW